MWGPIRRCIQYRATATTSYMIGLIFALWSIVVISFLTRSFIDLPNKLHLSQRCRMSRMWPSYVPYKLTSTSGLDAKYRLFLYREATPGRNSDADQPRGRPALFVPGNAGSFGQVRSIASSAHHLYHSEQAIVGVSEVDWWTVDFNEDFSAFHGQTMQEQATYLNEVISHLLHQYPSARKIPIVGHSMGGIVARLMLLKDNHPKDSVDTIITLSSPHAYPPVTLDKGIEEVYSSINSRWQDDANNTLLISLSGGILDNQLSSEPASLSLARIWHRRTSLSAFTASLAGLWSGVDHLAMMWCDQLRERLARGVLNIEGQEKPIQERREEWRRMLGIAADWHDDKYISRISSKQAHAISQDSILDESSITTFKIADANHTHLENFDLFTSQSVGLDTSFGPPIDQQAGIRVELCTNDKNCRYVLPSAYDLYPPFVSDNDFPRAEERYEMPGNGVRRLSLPLKHLISGSVDRIRIERKELSGSDMFIAADWIMSPKSFYITPHFWISAFIPFRDGQMSTSPSIRTIVSGVDSSLFAYDLRVVGRSAASGCKSKAPPMLKIQSGSTGDTQCYLGIQPGSQYTLTLHSTSPYMPPSAKNLSATSFNLLLDTCTQIEGVSLRINWRASAALLVSRYRSALIAFPFAIVMLASGLAWDDYNRGGDFLFLTIVLLQRSSLLLTILLSFAILLSIFQKAAFQFYYNDKFPVPIQNLSLGIAASSLLFNSILNILFLSTSYGATLTVSLAMDLLLHIFTKFSNLIPHSSNKNDNHQSFDIFHRPRATIISASILTILVWLVVPIQFVFLNLFLIQFLSAVQSLRSTLNHHSDKSRQVYATQQKGFLIMFFWLLPFNAPALLIWSRNLLRGYFGLLAGPDHNILAVSGFILITQISISGQSLHRSTFRIATLLTLALFAFVSASALAYGIRYTHILFSYTNLILLWLGVHHYFMQYRYRGESQGFNYTLTRKESDEVEEAIDTQIAAYSNIPLQIVNRYSLPESIHSSIKGAPGYSISDSSSSTTSIAVDEVKDIDTLLERYLDLLDEYFALKNQIGNFIASGSFQLSKAKMQLGRVSSFNDMWDARMKATLVVKISPDAKSVHLMRRSANQGDEVENDSLSSRGNVLFEAKEEVSTLRNRKNRMQETKMEALKEEKEDKKEKDNISKKNKSQPFDPLYQFSALPSPSLRKAQSQYIQMLETLIGVPSSSGLLQIQAEMQMIQVRIANLREEAQQGYTVS